jgi:hypothetical protein
VLDPRVDAVRRDLADVRLAGRVFAPHYAAPMPRAIEIPTALLSSRDGGDPIAALASGETFEVLELSGGKAWGVAPAHRLVGYVPAESLGLVT